MTRCHYLNESTFTWNDNPPRSLENSTAVQGRGVTPWIQHCIKEQKGVLGNLTHCWRKLTCEGPVAVTGSLEEGHHLAQIYGTITWGTTMTGCKIKGPVQSHGSSCILSPGVSVDTPSSFQSNNFIAAHSNFSSSRPYCRVKLNYLCLPPTIGVISYDAALYMF